MNRKEWLEACKNHEPGIYKWYNECLKIRKTLKYNQDPNATHKHHLFNTPEQIEYNNSHYEMWGFNEDGSFEYGKYIIFVTPEEHSKLHSDSDITKQRKSDAFKGDKNPLFGIGPMKGRHFSEEHKRKIGESNTGKKRSEEARKNMSDAQKGKHSGENNGMYGKFGKDNPNYGSKRSDETKRNISNSLKGHPGLKGSDNGMYGKSHTEESRNKMSDALKGRKQSASEIENRAKSIKATNEIIRKPDTKGIW